MSLPQKLSLISLASPRPTISVVPPSSAVASASLRRRPSSSSAQPRQSTESWSSVEEDETTYDWTYEHISVLTEALERAPSQLETPYTGVIPPSNLLDAIAREILDARPSKSEWPHSIRATRLKLIQVAKRQARLVAKAKTPHTLTSNRSGVDPDMMDVDVPSYAYAPRTPLRHQNSMDFLPIPEEPSPYHAATFHTLNTPANSHKLQHPSTSQKVTPHAAYHPYKRTPRNSTKIDEPMTPPPRPSRYDEFGDARLTAVPTPSAPSHTDGAPASLSAASSATLLSSMASRASLTTAVSGNSKQTMSSSHKVSRKAKTPRRMRITEGGELVSDVFGPELPATPNVSAGLAPKGSETKRLRSRTIPAARPTPNSGIPPAPGLQPKARITRGHVRSTSASHSASRPLAVSAEVYGELQADEVIRPRVPSRGSLRDNVPPIITTPAPERPPITPPSRPPAPTPFLLEPTTPSHRGLRRVGKLNVSGGRSNENHAPPSSPMQLSPSPHSSPLYPPTCSQRRQNGGAASCRPLSIMSRTSDRSERSALSNISAHSSRSGVSGLSGLGARSPPSRAARMIGRKISFGSDNDNGVGAGLRLHHGTSGAPAGVPSMTMMTLAPAFELR